MYNKQYHEFLFNEDSFHVYENGHLLYHSTKGRIIPWLEFIDLFSPLVSNVTVFDKVVGNAAALLAIKAGCRSLYSPVGSQLAADTLEKYHIKYSFINTIPYICKADSLEMCPLEKLSLDKRPEDFYETVRVQISMASKVN